MTKGLPVCGGEGLTTMLHYFLVSLDLKRSRCNPLTGCLSPVASWLRSAGIPFFLLSFPARSSSSSSQVGGPEPLTVAALWGKGAQVPQTKIFSSFKFELH